MKADVIAAYQGIWPGVRHSMCRYAIAVTAGDVQVRLLSVGRHFRRPILNQVAI